MDTKQNILPILTRKTVDAFGKEIYLDNDSAYDDVYFSTNLESIVESNHYVGKFLQAFKRNSGFQWADNYCGITVYKMLEKEAKLPIVSKETYEKFIEELDSCNKKSYFLYYFDKLEKNNPVVCSLLCKFYSDSKFENEIMIHIGVFMYRLLEMESISHLEKQMTRAVKEENYKEAAEIRDQLNLLK